MIGVGVVQRWVASVQVLAPAQASAGAQLRALSVDRHEKRQASQPSPLTLLPSSHSSGAVTTESPHEVLAHAPARQIPPVPQVAPSASGVPAAHLWSAPQLSVPVQASPSSHCV